MNSQQAWKQKQDGRRARNTGLPFTLYGLGEVQIGRDHTAMHWHDDAIVCPPRGGVGEPLTFAVYPPTGAVEMTLGLPGETQQRVLLHGEQIRAAARYLQAMADGLADRAAAPRPDVPVPAGPLTGHEEGMAQIRDIYRRVWGQ
jgi:hypothetical protein